VPTEIEDRLEELRHALPEPGVATGERMLGEVLARWSPPRRRRSPAPLRMLLAAALVVLVGGSLAYAVGGRVVDAVTGSPAPPKIGHKLASMVRSPFPSDGAPPWERQLARQGHIVVGSARRVLTIKTRWHGHASLYVARTSSGGHCSLSGWGSELAGGCSPSESFHDGTKPFALSTMGAGTGHVLVTGHVPSARAASIAIRFRHGGTHTEQLTAGWFMYEVPLSHQRTGTDPIGAIDALDMAGTRIERYRDPFRLNAPKPRFASPVPSSVRLVARAVLPNQGGTITIWSGLDVRGHECFRHLRDGKSNQFPVWSCTADVGHYGRALPTLAHPRGGQHVPVSWTMVGLTDPKRPVGYGYSYAFGFAAAGIARLELRFQDGDRTTIPLVLHDFLYVVPADRWPAGHRPSILTAYAANRRLVYRQFLYPRQHCVYPGRDPVCKSYGIATG
jgi:hypothetical protein